MAEGSVPIPRFAVMALLAGLLAIACAWGILALPTGEGEAGFAAFAGHVVEALIAADVLTIAWAVLAVASWRRRERGGRYLVAGLVALAVPAVYGLMFFLSQGLLSLIFGGAILVAPAWVIAGWILLAGSGDPDSHSG